MMARKAASANWTGDAQQKARFFGSSRNRVALAVLDTAEAMGLITKEEREGKAVRLWLSRQQKIRPVTRGAHAHPTQWKRHKASRDRGIVRRRAAVERSRDDHASVDKSRRISCLKEIAGPRASGFATLPYKIERKGLTAMPLATSPLRYPGGKSCMLGPISRDLRGNKLERGHYARTLCRWVRAGALIVV